MIEVTYTCWDKLFYRGEDRFFDALEVGGPGGESCLTMQAILFGGKRWIAKRYEIGQIETIATVLLATY